MKRYIISLILLFKKNGFKRALFLKKKNIFFHIGENVSFRPFVIPSEPNLVSIGDNVWIAAGVRFITHDMINQMLFLKGEKGIPNKTYYSNITIGNNVVVGADVIILPGKRIGDNVIIAAGSVVSKDIPSNEVWGGNPVKKICSYDDFLIRRMKKNKEVDL